MSMNREGPSAYQPESFRTCLGCKHHDHALIQSGLNPVYEDTCLHPIVDRPAPESWLASGLPAFRGRYIGRTQPPRTPDWCPFLTGQAEKG